MLLPVFLPWLLLCSYNLRGLHKSGLSAWRTWWTWNQRVCGEEWAFHALVLFSRCPGDQTGGSDANLPSEAGCCRASSRRKIIDLHGGFFSANLLWGAGQPWEMEGRMFSFGQLLEPSGKRFPVCRLGNWVGTEPPKRLHSQIPHPGSRGGGKKKPVQLELPFELILHFPGQCFSHAPTFKTNWKYFRAVSIHSLICLIAVWQYEISSECIPFSKIIITIATHTTSETQLFPTKPKNRKPELFTQLWEQLVRFLLPFQITVFERGWQMWKGK